MNVVWYEWVCCEKVCNERGLFWMACYEWSVLNGHRNYQRNLYKLIFLQKNEVI